MYGSYYKLPLDFKSLTQKKELLRITLEESITQNITLAATTSFGECRYDEAYGCRIWETDFELSNTEK